MQHRSKLWFIKRTKGSFYKIEDTPPPYSRKAKMILNLCIPCVDSIYSRDNICALLQKANIGMIHSIKEIQSHNKVNSKKVFVKVDVSEGESHRYLRERLEGGQNIKVIHEEPYYWKMIPCK